MSQAAKIVILVFDGLRPDMVTPERMPALHAFATSGLWFREARSVFPSMTRVATSSISTGAPPAVHGVVGNAFFYPEVTRDHVIDTSQAADVLLAERIIGGPLLTAPTMGEALAAHGRSFCVVHAGSAGSSYAINPEVKANGHWTFSVLGDAATRTPEAVAEVVARFGPLPPRNLPRYEETAYVTKVFSDLVLTEKNPDVALIWFNEPDTSFHYRFIGSEETRGIMTAVDQSFAAIMATIDARPDRKDIAVIVASDHGQISSSGICPLADLLTEAGHPAVKAGARSITNEKLVITGGNMGEIRCLDGDRDRRDAVARWLMQRDEIGMVLTPSDDPVHGSVEGTFSLALVGMDHARAPELMFVLRSGTEADAHGLPGLGLITGSVPVGGGMHGGLNRHELNTVLILGGAAHKGERMVSMAPSGIVDIAPTVLSLLGHAPLPPMRGQALNAEMAQQPLIKKVHEATWGGFRQRLAVCERGGHLFPVHGGRIA